MEIFSYPEGLDLLARWIHVIAGITWIGLLYYFNFVQGPFFNQTDPDVKATATRQLVPRALWWFRYAALVTFLAGVALLLIRLDSRGADGVFGSSYGFLVLTAGTLGTLMFLNVWGVIWPKQKIVIGSARAAASGGAADPRAAGATRRALLASRTNVVFSIPMLFFMAASAHPITTGNVSAISKLLYLVIAGALVLTIELNALVGSTGPTNKPLETVRAVLTSGFVLLAVLYVLFQLFGN
jgi:uncharacterized membrane protein